MKRSRLLPLSLSLSLSLFSLSLSLSPPLLPLASLSLSLDLFRGKNARFSFVTRESAERAAVQDISCVRIGTYILR